MSVRREKRVTKKRTLSVYIPIECRASVVVGGGIGRQGKGKKATTASGFSFAANLPMQPALRVLQMARNRSYRAMGECTAVRQSDCESIFSMKRASTIHSIIMFSR